MKASSCECKFRKIWLVLCGVILIARMCPVVEGSLKIRPHAQNVEDSATSASAGSGTTTDGASSGKNNNILASSAGYFFMHYHNTQPSQDDSSNKSLAPEQDGSKSVLMGFHHFFYSNFVQFYRRQFHKFFLANSFIFSTPRDWMDGLNLALCNIFQKGIWKGIMSFMEDGDIMASISYVLGGFLAGMSQVYQGLKITPQAIKAQRKGNMAWSQQEGQWKLYQLDQHYQQLQKDSSSNSAYSRRKTQLRQRSRKQVKDMEFYRRLKISSDATPQQIKRAYYNEARHIHPDKTRTSTARASAATTTTAATTSEEQFIRLTEAYRILSNSEFKDIYDQHGRCAVEQKIRDQDSVIDAYQFFAVMFGSFHFEPYIGELRLASVVDNLFQLFDIEVTKTQNSFSQELRVVEIALFLRNRIKGYVDGTQSEVEFRTGCQQDAEYFAVTSSEDSFTDFFLRAIGKSIASVGSKYVLQHSPAKAFSISQRMGVGLVDAGSELSRGYHTLADSFRVVISILPKYWAAVTRQQNEQPSEEFKFDESSSSSSPASCPNNADATATKENEELTDQLQRTIPEIMRLGLQLNDNDIHETLKDACGKVLLDYVPPSNSKKHNTKQIQLRRAKALQILGQEFYEKGQEIYVPNRFKDRQKYQKRVMDAFETALHWE